jgi:energy-coupling factor transporter ATP-binding protein EcfA2
MKERNLLTTPGLFLCGLEAGLGTMTHDLAYIGHRYGYGGEIPFGIQTVDRRQHVYVIGKTGSGKTTLLRNLIVQHIAAGHGVGLIDPHGDLADELLDHIPSHRTRHVVFFNPSDRDFPIAVNLLGDVPPDDRHLIASGIVSAFKSIWRDSWGPRMEYILYNALAALLDCQGATLLGVPRMLVDAGYRQWVVRQVEDPFVKAFWTDEFENYDERFVREAISPIQNKVGQFFTNPPMRNILGQVQNKVDFRFMMDNQRIFIANLSKGKLGEDKANLLGSLLTTQFQLAAMSRAHIPEQERRDFFLFIDEFHNFTTDSFASILSEARKYRLNLTLSHQYIAQLPLPIRDAVFGNVGTLVSFRVGNADAAVMEREFGETLRASQFTDLDRFEIIFKPLVDGLSGEPFKGRTLAPMVNACGRRAQMIEQSRSRFSTGRNVVEQKIRAWLERRF